MGKVVHGTAHKTIQVLIISCVLGVALWQGMKFWDQHDQRAVQSCPTALDTATLELNKQAQHIEDLKEEIATLKGSQHWTCKAEVERLQGEINQCDKRIERATEEKHDYYEEQLDRWKASTKNGVYECKKGVDQILQACRNLDCNQVVTATIRE
jgi:predicted negative regulator of RcsB-dependent stress response